MTAIEHGRRPLRLTARLLRPRAGIAYSLAGGALSGKSHGIGQESGRSLAQVGAPWGLPPPLPKWQALLRGL